MDKLTVGQTIIANQNFYQEGQDSRFRVYHDYYFNMFQIIELSFISLSTHDTHVNTDLSLRWGKLGMMLMIPGSHINVEYVESTSSTQ